MQRIGLGNETTPKRPVSRSTRDRFVLSDDISIDAVHSDVDVQQTGSAAVSQVGDTTRTVFLEASSVLHEVLHESNEDGDTDSSMGVEMEVAEETDLQTMKSLPVPRMSYQRTMLLFVLAKQMKALKKEYLLPIFKKL